MADSLTCLASTSCASTVITNGKFYSYSTSAPLTTNGLFSYDQSRCLGEHDNECPRCARTHGITREIRRNNERLACQHEVFLAEVHEGGFAAVAAGFSRGILNMGHAGEVGI